MIIGRILSDRRMLKVFGLVWCLVFLEYVDFSSAVFTKDTGCGETKGCFSDCESGCTYLIAWSSGVSTVSFKIQVELPTNADQYGAFGLSATQSMASSSVTSCIMTNSGATFHLENSYNMGYSNAVLNSTDGLSLPTGSYNGTLLTCEFERDISSDDTNVFNLQTDYYMLYAKGSISAGLKIQHGAGDMAFSSVVVDLQSNVDSSAGVNKRIKAHGSLAVVAWMIMANIGYVIARYYKPLFPSKKILGADVWFMIHRVLMVLAAILTITSFGVIIHGHFSVGETSFEKSHPYIGVIVLCLVIINPILGILRPDKESKYRPIFYWFHYCIGAGVIILALINIFIGIRLEKSQTSDKAYYIFIAYEVFQVTMIVVLEVLNIIGKNKTKHVTEDVAMKPVDVKDRITAQPDENNQPYAWTPKLVLLCIHIFVTIVLPFAIVGIIASSTSSSD